MSLIPINEVELLFPDLLEVPDLGAALLRASIFVRSQVTEVPNPVPDDLKMAVCLLVRVEHDGPILKEVSRSDYKETFDTKDQRLAMIDSLLAKYQTASNTINENKVEFL